MDLLELLIFGSGGAPAISVSPSSWDFGSTPVGTAPTKEFTVTNLGTATLLITLPITMVDDEGDPVDGFTVTVDPATTIAPGASTTFTVQADADSVDTFNAEISIESNAAGSPTLIPVTVEVQSFVQVIQDLLGADALFILPMYQETGTTLTDESGNGFNGTTTNVTLAAGLSPTNEFAPFFTGSASRCNVYSAGLAADYTPDEFSFSIAFRFNNQTDYDDGGGGFLFHFQADASNYVYFRRFGHEFLVQRNAGGTVKNYTYTPPSFDAGWIRWTFTVSKSNDRQRFYWNGTLLDAKTGLGTWAGALASTTAAIGAFNSTGSTPAKMHLAYAIAANRELTGAEVLALSDYAIVPTLNYMPIGDSKSTSACYVTPLNLLVTTAQVRTLREQPLRIAGVGATVADNAALIDAELATRTDTPDYVLINLGTNDASALPTENDFKTDYRYIIDAVHTKWSSVPIYLAKPVLLAGVPPSSPVAAVTSIHAWIDDLIAEYAFVYLGIVETALEGGNGYFTNFADAAHPNTTGYAACAALWKTALGL